jgi:hypothetical protein
MHDDYLEMILTLVRQLEGNFLGLHQLSGCVEKGLAIAA